MPVNTTTRLERLRKLMRQSNLHAYIIPSEDAHQSEYIAQSDARRAFISGFTGSSGLAVVTLDKAALWTDGRYFLQASHELDENWTLMKSGLPETPTKETWLLSMLPANARVGVDPWLISVRDATALQNSLLSKGFSLVALPPPNFIDQVWDTQKPSIHHHRIFPLDTAFSGMGTQAKLDLLLESVQHLQEKFHGVLLTALDDVAWFFNLRGSDIPFNPVFFAYAYIPTQPGAPSMLFLHDASKLEKVPDHVVVHPYAAVHTLLPQMIPKDSLVLSDGRCNWALALALGKQFHLSPAVHPVVMAKAIKNPTEMQGFRDCHVVDAVALIRYFAWLEDQLQKERTVLDEVDAADQLLQFRRQQPHFMGPSFDTISSSGPNGAVIHYKPAKPTARTLCVQEMYLCDSGGQYLNGTTDVTRTLHMGTPTSLEKRAYTRVLQGHIAVDQVVFPKNTSGFVLDILARAPLWKDHLEFRHGVGHGVGHFLNVHEGPQAIACRPSVLDIQLQHGMTLTNEPGYYHPDHFGIRIENVLLCIEDKEGFMKFEHVTWVPMDRRLILKELLNPDEIQWLNQYHKGCWDKLNLMLKDDPLAYSWLKWHTQPL